MLERLATLVILALGAMSTLVACDGDAPPPADGPGTRATPLVLTSFYPTQYMAERIGGDDVDVRCPLPDDADPIYWKPSRDDVRAFQRADLVVLNGAQLEKWVSAVSLPATRTIDTARPFRAEFLEYEDAVQHSHGRGAEHAHTGIDGHTWLDPRNAKRQAAEVRRGLEGLLPGKADQLAERFQALAADLHALDEAFRALGLPAAGTHLYASHPAYNYVAKRYAWPVVNLDLDPETMPSDEQIDRVRTQLAERPGTFLLWESEPEQEIAERLSKELGLTSVVFSPCEMRPGDGQDYLAVMRANLGRIRTAFPDAK